MCQLQGCLLCAGCWTAAQGCMRLDNEVVMAGLARGPWIKRMKLFETLVNNSIMRRQKETV